MQRLRRIALIVFEIILLSALILTTRCANYSDVFIGGKIYFTDADCYARMTRVRMCAEHPGLVVRRHDFENFPQGTNPHTTAPLDYLILASSLLIRPFTTGAIDFAGAWISPVLALLGGWFLWWWSRRTAPAFRWVALILYAISPILVHGTELGRPDHQSLLILLLMIALCSEWILRESNPPDQTAPETPAIRESRIAWTRISALNGVAWGFAIWVSAYEPLVLLGIVLLCVVGTRLVQNRAEPPQAEHLGGFVRKYQRFLWIGAVLLIALLIERRVPELSIFRADPIYQRWSQTIGELSPVSAFNLIWFRWAGWLLLATPVLIWVGFKKKTGPPFFAIILLITTYGLTVWQARWGYFFLFTFAIVLPRLLESIKWRSVVWIAFVLSLLPILQDWDEKLWPNETEISRRSEQRYEAIQLRALALNMMSAEQQPFIAPWWLSPSIVYWSGQPGVAGSSHESIKGIADSAHFFLAEDSAKAYEILRGHKANWVLAYNSERVGANSAVLLDVVVPENALCRILDRSPTQAPRFLVFSAQNGTGKLYWVGNNL